MKRTAGLIVVLLLFCGFGIVPRGRSSVTNNSNSVQSLKCFSGVVIDANSGRVLYSRNGNRVLPMASTTKIITAIVAIEKGNLRDKVTVSRRAASISGSTVGLKVGEELTLEELLYGLMLKSGNDAAIAIAEHISGSVENFAKLMNDKVLALGAFNTSFVTPHGLDAENHYTTAEDLAKITAYAMNNPVFARISSTKTISSGVSGNFKRAYSNINRFIYRMESADGVKTGYTGRAGRCLVASVRHENGRYIAVVLNSNDRWADAEKMIKYAETNYKYVKILNNNESLNKCRVYGGNKKYITGTVKRDLYLPVLKNDTEVVNTQFYTPSTLFSPVDKGDIIGNVVVFVNNVIVAKYPIYSDTEVKRKNYSDLTAFVW